MSNATQDEAALQALGHGLNATITVTYAGADVTFDLDGNELSPGSNDHLYLSNASRGFIADRVEQALIELTTKATS